MTAIKPLLLSLIVLTSPLVQSAEPVVANDESQLIAVLQSNASLTQKDAACARLKRIGTASAVPALAALLPDEQLSHSARYALESMPFPEAGKALIDALSRTSGPTRAGIIMSLGARRELLAAEALLPLCTDADREVAEAAVAALGNLGGENSLGALLKLLSSSDDAKQKVVADAVMNIAYRLSGGGKQVEARAAFRQLYEASTANGQVQQAAYRGLILSSGAEGLGLATRAIAEGPPPAQAAALQLVRELGLPGATAAFSGLLNSLEPVVKVALIEGLALRADPAATSAVAVQTRDASPEVRLAALNALGILGRGAEVSLLAETSVAGTAAEKATAQQSLTQLRGEDVQKELTRLLKDGKPELQAAVASVIAARGDRAQFPALIGVAKAGIEPASESALRALADLADRRDLPEMVRLVVDTDSPKGRASAAEALNTAFQRLQAAYGEQDPAPLLEALAKASPAGRAALVAVLGNIVHPAVRAALRAGLKDPELQVREAAVRTLAATTDAELLPDLVALAVGTQDESVRTLAVGGCARLATDEEGARLPASDRAQALSQLLRLNLNQSQKRLILAGLGGIKSGDSLSAVVALLEDPSVRAEAAQAVIRLAAAAPGHPAAATALARVIETVPETATVAEARKVLQQVETFADSITSWKLAGPYRQEGKNYSELFGIAFPPEAPDDRVQWRSVTAVTDPKQPGLVNLLKEMPGEQCVAYVKTSVYAPAACSAVLAVASDDGVKIWLNGQVVHENNTARPIQAAVDAPKVSLKAGWNTLLMKITQNNQGWEFQARFIKPDGSRLTGLRFDANH